jgi:[histone H3]-lysine36 N-dimethyltransferase SETMAR
MTENLKFEQRAVIKFFSKLGKNATEIEADLKKVYGESTLPYRTVAWWVAEFRRGRESLEDDPRSGRPPSAVTDENIQKAEKLVKEDRRIKVKQLEEALGIGAPAIDAILHDHLGLSKLCARWVPRLLTREQKEFRASASLELLHHYDRDPSDFRCRLVTGDESWIYWYDPETKAMSKQWLPKGSNPPIKAKVTKSAGKTMLTLFFDAEGWLLTDFLVKGATITGQYYAGILEKLRQAIKEKRRGKLRKGVLLLDDNAPVHRAGVVLDAIHDLHWTRLNHPPYSPDLAPSDYRLFPDLKKSLKGKKFEDENEVKDAVMHWLDSQPKSYWENVISEARERWLKCFNLEGDYIEKCKVSS